MDIPAVSTVNTIDNIGKVESTNYLRNYQVADYLETQVAASNSIFELPSSMKSILFTSFSTAVSGVIGPELARSVTVNPVFGLILGGLIGYIMSRKVSTTIKGWDINAAVEKLDKNPNRFVKESKFDALEDTFGKLTLKTPLLEKGENRAFVIAAELKELNILLLSIETCKKPDELEEIFEKTKAFIGNDKVIEDYLVKRIDIKNNFVAISNFANHYELDTVITKLNEIASTAETKAKEL